MICRLFYLLFSFLFVFSCRCLYCLPVHFKIDCVSGECCKRVRLCMYVNVCSLNRIFLVFIRLQFAFAAVSVKIEWTFVVVQQIICISGYSLISCRILIKSFLTYASNLIFLSMVLSIHDMIICQIIEIFESNIIYLKFIMIIEAKTNVFFCFYDLLTNS